MTPADKSPREVWVTPNILMLVENEIIPLTIKVVPHSAYLAVKQELDEAQAQIKDYREALAFVNEEFVPDRGPTVYVGREDLEKARQVLEKWK